MRNLIFLYGYDIEQKTKYTYYYFKGDENMKKSQVNYLISFIIIIFLIVIMATLPSSSDLGNEPITMAGNSASTSRFLD